MDFAGVKHEGSIPLLKLDAHWWFLVLGMASFWQLFRYSNLHGLFRFGWCETWGVSIYFGVLVGVVVLLSAVFLIATRKGAWLASIKKIVAALAVLSTVALLILHMAAEDLAGSWAVALGVACSLVLGSTMLALLYGWTGLFARLVSETLEPALLALVASAVITLFVSLAESFDSLFSDGVRIAQPAISSAFLLAVLKRGQRANVDAASVPLRRKWERLARKGDMSAFAWCVPAGVLLVLASLAKGAIGPTPLSFMDSPERLYSCFVTLVVGMLITGAIVSRMPVRKLAFLVYVVVTATLALGLLFLGCLGERGAYLSSACLVTSRAWLEVLLFAAVVVLGNKREPIALSIVFFVAPEVASSVLRRFVLPAVAHGEGMPLFIFVQEMSIPLAVALLILCCLVLARIALGAMGEPQSDSRAAAKDDADAAVILARKYSLTSREATVVSYLLRGYSVPLIAEREVISVSTVQTHCRNAYAKLGVHSKRELVSLAEKLTDET